MILLTQNINRDEKIGFHKGALDTLVKERQELMKIVSITSKLIEMHVSALKEMGIDLTQQVQPEEEQPKKKEDFGDFY